jgi:hypothetical protein
MQHDAFLNDPAGNVCGGIDRCPLYRRAWMGIVLDAEGRHHQLERAVIRVTVDNDAILSIVVPTEIAFNRIGSACHGYPIITLAHELKMTDFGAM